jgi:hypothetical protein
MRARTIPAVRYQLFLPRELSERFERAAGGAGAPKSRLLAGAVEAWLERRGTGELEPRFTARLGALADSLARIEREGQVQRECLALFVRYMLAVHPPLSGGDEAARIAARERFAAFVERAARQVASGRSLLTPEHPR